MDKIVLETADLFIGKASFSDWEALYRSVWSHAETARYMLWSPTASKDDARRRMERTLRYQKEQPAFTVYEKASGEAIGFAGLTEAAPGVYEDTGLALGPAFTGRGYGTQVLQALMRYAFDTLHAQTLVCGCRSANEASRRLQMRCGLRFDHAEPRTDARDGTAYTLEFYSLTRAQYEALGAAAR